jgi:hypothetical protein
VRERAADGPVSGHLAHHRARAPPSAVFHFYDTTSAPLEKFEPAWSTLRAFFGAVLPERVTVDYELQGTSHFDPRTNAVHLVVASYHGEPELAAVAHETSHLALAMLATGASTEQNFRFLDEGLATVMQYEVQGLAAQRQRLFRAHAAEHPKAGRATLSAMQLWSTYFGNPTVKADYSAYEDGAAFVFFLSDTYGQMKLRNLFVDLGRHTRSRHPS